MVTRPGNIPTKHGHCCRITRPGIKPIEQGNIDVVQPSQGTYPQNNTCITMSGIKSAEQGLCCGMRPGTRPIEPGCRIIGLGQTYRTMSML